MRPDFDAARKSLAAFAAMIGHPLTDWQARDLELTTRTTCILAPRQTGKSRSLAVLALWWAFTHPGARILIVSAGEEASRRLLALIRGIAMQSPLLAGSVLDEQAALLTFSNGASIRSAPASERSIRGETADLLLIDEAALVSDDVGLGAAFPTTAARPEARIVMASSPWAEGGFFYNHVTAGDSEHVHVHRWSLDDATWIAREVIEAARASMSEARFAAEFEARWASSLDAIFTRAVLERCRADVELPALADLRGPARLLGGQDWGVTTDRSALAWVARVPVAALNPDFDRPVFVATTKAWPAGEPLSDVVSEVVASPAHWSVFNSEQSGVGAGPTQELFKRLAARSSEEGGGRRSSVVMWEERPWDPTFDGAKDARRSEGEFRTRKNPVATSAPIKALMFERLRWLFDRQQIVTSDTELMRELASLRVELRPGGHEKIEAGAGHDDRADALMLAAGPMRDRRRKQLRCLIAEAADSRRPDAQLPEDFSGEVVETGGGLRVWRRPPLQSCAGPNVSLPDAGQPGAAHIPGRFTIRKEARR